MTDTLKIGSFSITSRLIIGTGKYKDFEENAAALKVSGADMITVAVRRVNISDPSQPRLTDVISPKDVLFLPNTAFCYTAEEAITTARLAREALDGHPLVKLEILGDTKTLFPDNEATLAAAKVLIKDGFTVLPYCIDDPIVCKKLEDLGCAAVMPLAAPIGSGLGMRNPHNIQLILEGATVPVIVDAGVGTASDAAQVMELGCDAVLMNTAIAGAKDPIAMAEAMKLGVQAGRIAYKAGRIPKKLYATASSPIEGVIGAK